MMRLFFLAALLILSACERKKSIREEYPAEVSALATEGGKGLPFFVGKDLRPVWNLKNSPKPRLLEAFSLKDQKSQKLSSDSLKGKISVVSFFYASCHGICPMATENLRTVQDHFLKNDRVQMISISVAPQHDSPKKLSEFARKHHIDYGRWKLLTGDRDQIYKVARDSFGADTFSAKENDKRKVTKEDFLHSENVYLLDDQQRLRGVYQGRMPSSLNELIRDTEILIQ